MEIIVYSNRHKSSNAYCELGALNTVFNGNFPMIYQVKCDYHYVADVVIVQLLSCVQLFVTPWTAAHTG